MASSRDSSAHAALRLCAILFILSWLKTVVEASPRFVETQQQQQPPRRDGQYAVELQTRPSSRRAANANVVNLPEALRRFTFNDGASGVRRLELDSEGGSDSTIISSSSSSDILQDGTAPRLAEIALAVTVDGAIHAIRRDNGLWVWSVHDDNPLQQRDDVLRAPLVKSSNNGLARGDNQTSASDVDDEEIYIIEPHSAGDIYVYHKPTGKMQRLPLSMSQLVDLSPFTFPSESAADGDGRLFVGRKETKLVGVDLQTGKLVGVFGPEAGWCEWKTLRRSALGRQQGGSDAAFLQEDADEDSIDNRPQDLLYLGKTDYHISIYSKSQGLLQTLQYTAYGPSSLATAAATGPVPPAGQGSASSGTPARDGRYIQPMHDGSLICFQSGSDGLQWTNHFPQAVVAVYDIVLPAYSGSGKSSQPLLQPHPAQEVHSGLADLANLPPATFVGKTELPDGQAEYFAMSNSHYPLVSFAPMSSLGAANDSTAGHGKPSSAVGGLLGTHRIEEPLESGKTIDPAPEPPLGIDPPPSEDTRWTPHPPASDGENAIGKLPAARALWTSVSLQATLLLVVSLVVSLLYLRKYLKRQQVSGKVQGRRIRVSSPTVRSEKGPLPQSEATTPDASEGLSTTISLPSSSAPPVDAIAQPRLNGHKMSPSMEKALPALPSERSALPVIKGEAEGQDDLTDKEDEGFEGSGDGKDANGFAVKNPKKGRRRKRGKRGGINNGQQDKDEAEDIASPPPRSTALDAVPATPALVPETVATRPKEAGQIGSLTISEEIIGYGSQGTVVLKGTFQGRAVAVKRLLKDFVTVASHEVQLLQESDSHNNVIRYFYKEQHDNFMYIALELCPASLFELIDTPDKFPELIKAFDPIKALKQITKGLQHLHKLKIIHRDLKPQNILIALSTSAVAKTAQPKIRMVISDFGLCKKLDLDESSFLQSTRGGGHHAAGSFGYRAPEVLRGEVDASELINNDGGISDTQASSSTASTSTLAPRSASDGAASGSGRKLTRSIDIFSLGCIFYFVLTMGDHPFGSRYEREVNILNDKITLDGLSMMTENIYEAQELVRAMCAADAQARPSAGEITLDPLFWTPAQALHFLCDASDRFEIMDKEALAVLDLEEKAAEIVGTDWLRNGLDRNLVDNLGKYRKYDGGSVRDLMRVLRNKKHHYQDLPENVRKSLGEPPAGFLSYFTRRFPKLVLHVHSIVKMYLADERLFSPYFELVDDS